MSSARRHASPRGKPKPRLPRQSRCSAFGRTWKRKPRQAAALAPTHMARCPCHHLGGLCWVRNAWLAWMLTPWQVIATCHSGRPCKAATPRWRQLVRVLVPVLVLVPELVQVLVQAQVLVLVRVPLQHPLLDAVPSPTPRTRSALAPCVLFPVPLLGDPWAQR